MSRVARALAALTGWRRYGLAFVLGALAAIAFAPLYVLPVLAIGFTGLIWLLDGVPDSKRRFAVVWCFAWGHFIVCFYWIGYAFFVDAEQFGWLVPAPVLGLPAAMALYPAVTATIALRLAPGGARRILAFGLAWIAAEWLRGHVLTGFPWNETGYVWASSVPMMQTAAVVGVLGLSLITVVVAALPALLGAGGLHRGPAWRWVGGGAALLAVLWIGGTLRLPAAAAAVVPGIVLRLVQANNAQQPQLTADERAAHFERYLQLSSAPGADRITQWIWPESAVPYFVDRDFGALRVLQGLVRDRGLLLTGADRLTPPDQPELKAWVSLRAISSIGIAATYDKHHLVPFGEYLPFRPLLGVIGLRKLTSGTIDFSSGTSPTILHLAGLPPVRPLICYEDIFGDEVGDSGDRAAWLLNVSNDSWFGTSTGPYQHFAISRFRAVEQGLPLIRVTTTGTSAIVDPYGRVMQSLGLDQAGVIDGPLPQPLAPTPYARFGDLLVVPMVMAALGLIALAKRDNENI